MSYQYAIFDPRPQGAAANEAVIKAAVVGVFGVEVTLSELGARCLLGNIDPQHGFHVQTYDNTSGYMELTDSDVREGETAIEFAARQPALPACPAMIPPDGATLVTVKADLDSVGGMAVLTMLLKRESLESARERIEAVAKADRFAMGDWPGSRPLPTAENPWPSGGAADSTRELAAINAAVADFKVPIADRVAAMERWLLMGEEPEQYRTKVEAERAEMIHALESGDIRHEVVADCKIAVINSTHRAATAVGYCFAPVVVAVNPAFKVGGGEPHKKFTVCQYDGGRVNFPATLAELQQLEPGWGGNVTAGIIGSPQGVASKLTTEQVVEVVAKHLIK